MQEETAMPAKPKPRALPRNPLADIRAYRTALGENQATFWARFGATQSGGSRYESGREMPTPTAMLVLAFAGGLLDDGELKRLKSKT
jgi:DNA-binding transcriptional regulator YiaG